MQPTHCLSQKEESYRKAIRIKGRSCSYSLETMRFYYGDAPEDRINLVETYGDGKVVYFLAPWSNRSVCFETQTRTRSALA